MNTATRLGAFAVGLAVVFAGAVGVGRLTGPATAADQEPGDREVSSDQEASASTAAGSPGGLQVSERGYSLRLSAPTAPVGASTLTFSIVGADGRPVTAYRTAHDKELHLILVQRDLSGYRHLHPVRDAAGTWRVPVELRPGTYRVFADFQPAAESEGLTLGSDLIVPGSARPAPLPAPSRTTTVDDYEIGLDGDLRPGTASRLTLTVRRNGKPVTDLEPYLGAYGHLVALRAGDLAYLHVHPDGEPGDGRTAAGPGIAFHAEVPSSGTYRLFLDFKHRGAVRTAEFTAVAGPGTLSPPAPSAPSPTDGGHDDGHDDGHGG
jgi:hypothetical protein